MKKDIKPYGKVKPHIFFNFGKYKWRASTNHNFEHVISCRDFVNRVNRNGKQS